jgi:hypothetical protein
MDASVEKGVRTDALKFIVHLVADAHQPLHTGFALDGGGTNIKLTHPNMSLHEVWDFEIINRLKNHLRKSEDDFSNWETIVATLRDTLKKSPELARKVIQVAHPKDFLDSRSRLIDFGSRVVSETSTELTCEAAYMNEHAAYIEDGDVISDDYFESRIGIVSRQLLRASIRLASLICYC